MGCPPASLQLLPPEIHFAAKNPALSLVSTSIHAFLSRPYVTPTYVAEYLLDLYSSCYYYEVLVKALRHPVCSVDVAQAIQRIWDRRRGYVPPDPKTPPDTGDDARQIDEEAEDSTSQSSSPRRRQNTPPPPPTLPALAVAELPRRLFRDLQPKSPVPELLRYIFETYQPITTAEDMWDPPDDYSPGPIPPDRLSNSHNGYPLSRAVLSKNKDVIGYLLHRGADPRLRDGLAVEIAVKLGDVDIVRLLVDDPEGGWRIRITQRFVELAVRSGSDAVVQYFVHEHDVMPPLQSIMRLGSDTQPKKRKVSEPNKKATTAFEKSKSRRTASKQPPPSVTTSPSVNKAAKRRRTIRKTT